jgi:hypothetical protein
MSREFILSNLHVEKSIISKGSILGVDVYGKTVHAPSMETSELFIDGQAQVKGDLYVGTEFNVIPQGGIQSNGDFILSATTSESEWSSPHLFSTRVISGNRIGQICQIYIELTSSSTISNGDILFTKVPDSFWPKTKVCCQVSVWNGSSMIPATLTFNPPTNQILYFGQTWNPSETLTGTIMYLRLA